MCTDVEQLGPSAPAAPFFRSCARKSTRHESQKSKPDRATNNFSTNPQSSSQQQALDMYFYLNVFVKALVPVKIISPSARNALEPAAQEILRPLHFHSLQATCALYTWPKNEYSTSAGYFSGG
jgi:hypothetical protein